MASNEQIYENLIQSDFYYDFFMACSEQIYEKQIQSDFYYDFFYNDIQKFTLT